MYGVLWVKLILSIIVAIFGINSYKAWMGQKKTGHLVSGSSPTCLAICAKRIKQKQKEWTPLVRADRQ